MIQSVGLLSPLTFISRDLRGLCSYSQVVSGQRAIPERKQLLACRSRIATVTVTIGHHSSILSPPCSSPLNPELNQGAACNPLLFGRNQPHHESTNKSGSPVTLHPNPDMGILIQDHGQQGVSTSSGTSRVSPDNCRC